MIKRIKPNGFTLVELLVAIAVVMTTTTLVFAIITATFRAGSKTSSLDQLRLAGNSAILQLTKLIQYADGFEGVKSGGTLLATCDETGDLYDSVQISVDGATKTVSCLTADEADLTLDGNSVIDKSKYAVKSCTLICSQADSTATPVIKINFDISALNKDGVEEAGSRTSFSRTVKMRNLNQ